MDEINKPGQLEELIGREEALLVYFSSAACNVCKVLKPKVAELLEQEFPRMRMVYSDTVLNPEAAGQHRVFTIPTILVFFQGREYFRFARNIGLQQLEESIARPYSLVFGD